MIVESETFVKAPLVSVIVLTYNQEKYISKTIESILSQICGFEYELIIAEDCGTDRTREICTDYQKKYPEKIKLLLQEKNEGIMGNYLDALKLCRGEYIAQCAGDDYWTDMLKLQKQINILVNNKEYGLVFTDTDFYYEQNKKFEFSIFSNGTRSVYDNFIDHLVNFGFLAPSTWMYRRNLSPLHFKYTKNYVDESFVYLLDMFQQSKIYFLNDNTSVYRRLPYSANNPQDKKKNYEHFKGLYEIQSEYLKKYKIEKKISDKIISNGFLIMLKRAIIYKDNKYIEEARFFFEEKNIDFNEILSVFTQYQNAIEMLNSIKKSKTYILGKFILWPFKLVKKIFK